MWLKNKGRKIINQGKEFPNLEDVQINKPVKITSPKLNKEAKVEQISNSKSSRWHNAEEPPIFTRGEGTRSSDTSFSEDVS